jgi:hypothetical protein
VEGVPIANRGKLHATPIQSARFQNVSNQVFSTADLKVYPGSIGSALCVEVYHGTFYPAAVCVGGINSASVRILDPDIVDLINQAEYNSKQCEHHTGGGPDLCSPDRTYSPLIYGFADVIVELDDLGTAGAAYRFLEDTNFTFYLETSNRFACLMDKPYTLEFFPVPGYMAPDSRLLQLSAGETKVVFGRYQAWGSNYLDAGGRLWVVGSSGSVYRVEHAAALPPSNGWTFLQRLALTNRAQVVTNDLPASHPAGFYRAVLEP